MEGYIESQAGFVIESDYYGMSLDPCGDFIEIWHLGEHVADFASINEFLLKYEINGKKVIELISDFEFC